MTWEKWAISFNQIGKSPLSVGSELSFRMIDHSRTRQIVVGLLFAKYSLPAIKTDLILTYGWGHFFQTLGDADLYQLALKRSIQTGNWTINGSIAVDRIYFASDKYQSLNRWRYRFVAGLSYRLSRDWKCKVQNEYLYISQASANSGENRAQAGFYLAVYRHADVGLSYLNRWVEYPGKANLDEHTLLTEIVFNF